MTNIAISISYTVKGGKNSHYPNQVGNPVLSPLRKMIHEKIKVKKSLFVKTYFINFN